MAKQRRIMRKFEIHELSAVDKPAQEGAKMVLMKRDDSIEKALPVPNADESKVDFTARVIDHPEMKRKHPKLEQRTSAAGTIHDSFTEGSPQEEAGESPDAEAAEGMEKRALAYFKATFTASERKDLVQSGAAMTDGSFPIRNATDLENALHAQGRAKSVDAARAHIKSRATVLGLESTLPDSFGETNKSANSQGDEEMELKDLEKRVASLEAELAKRTTERDEALRVAKMSDLEKGAEQDKTNPVVYTSAAGESFRKNDDPRMVAMAKRSDENEKKASEAAARELDSNLAKRADGEFAKLPGEQSAKVALLKAVHGIADEPTRTKVEAILAASASSLAKAFQSLGHRNVGDGAADSPVKQIDALAKRRSTDMKIPYAKAYVEVLDTDEGKALYAQTTGAGKGV